MISKSIDQLKKEAEDWAKTRVEGIVASIGDSERIMNGEEEKIVESLKEWGLEIKRLSYDQVKIVKIFLAKQKFDQLKAKYAPQSKWEKVTGRRLKTRD